jgi:hypothetical protein
MAYDQFDVLAFDVLVLQCGRHPEGGAISSGCGAVYKRYGVYKVSVLLGIGANTIKYKH